jgi:ketosteroid isomerase-like protein
MIEEQNTRVVREAYAAFGRGDVQSLLASFDDNIVWKPVTGAGQQVPTAGERKGKVSVGEFFAIVAKHINFERFEPREFVAQGDKVVALGHYTGKTPIGKRFDSDFVMVFTLRNGKVTHFQEFSDSAALNAAFETVTV